VQLFHVQVQRNHLLAIGKTHSFFPATICLDMGDAGNKNFACAHAGCTMSTKGGTIAHLSISFVFRGFSPMVYSC
jgi:hypothetical protein